MKRAQVAVGLAAVCLLAAGCTGNDPAPSPSTSASVSSTSSASASTAPSSTSAPTATGPAVAIPAAAKAHTRAGAEAMATFFLNQSDTAYTTNDATTVQGISASGCIGCANVIKTVSTNKAKGLRQVGRALHVDGVTPPGPTAHGPQESVDLLISGTQVNVVDKSGQTVRQTRAGKFTLRVLLSWRPGGWLIDAAGQAN